MCSSFTLNYSAAFPSMVMLLCCRETFEACARRETLEETGLVLKTVEVHSIVNAIWPEENYHYISIIIAAEIDTSVRSEPENLEPEKCEGIFYMFFDNEIL